MEPGACLLAAAPPPSTKPSGTVPRDVEHAFGRDDQPPLAVDLPGGQVKLAGSIDRVDETSDGELVVIDYCVILCTMLREHVPDLSTFSESGLFPCTGPF